MGSNLLLMIILLMIAALVIGASLFFLMRYMSPEPSPVESRLSRIKNLQLEQEQLAENPAMARLSKMYTVEYSNANLGKMISRYELVQGIKRTLSQAGMAMTVDRFVLFFWIIPIVAGIVLSVILKNGFLLLAGFVIAYGSILFLKFRRARRFKKIVTQLPDAMNLITSSLRAGHAFQSALTVVSSEMPDPVSTEFSAVVRDINFGIPVKEAMEKMVQNLDTLSDIRMFVTAVQIQRESGGNLAEILDKLSYTIRERFKLKGQVAALTGQARLTGYLLGGAPIVLLIGLTVFIPDYVSKLYNTSMGQTALAIGGFMQLVGFYVMKRIVDIRV